MFGLHASMNLWWEVFAIDDTALGGWLANGARLPEDAPRAGDRMLSAAVPAHI